MFGDAPAFYISDRCCNLEIIFDIVLCVWSWQACVVVIGQYDWSMLGSAMNYEDKREKYVSGHKGLMFSVKVIYQWKPYLLRPWYDGADM